MARSGARTPPVSAKMVAEAADRAAREREGSEPNPGLVRGAPGLFECRAIPFERPRPLFTVEEDSLLWTGTNRGFSSVDGGFFRLKPPVGASEEQIAGMKGALLKAGALAVRVMPRQASQVVVEAARAPAPKPESLREAAMSCAQEAASSDRPALLAKVEGLLARVGL